MKKHLKLKTRDLNEALENIDDRLENTWIMPNAKKQIREDLVKNYHDRMGILVLHKDKFFEVPKTNAFNVMWENERIHFRHTKKKRFL